MRELLAAVTLLTGIVQVPGPATGEPFVAGTVRLEPAPGTVIEVAGRNYRGAIEIGGYATGVAVVEETTVDDYLLGIREVPFSWDDQALAAQAVAARTYLAWTLRRGRSSNGRRYGYDICATSACQVYAGLDGVEGEYGDRWRAAVEGTAGEVLLYEGSPAMAVYSSTSGGRTRSAADVFGTDVPYLQAVDSPGEPSPFVDWQFDLDLDQMTALLTEAGLVDGKLQTIRTHITPDGEGPWLVEIVTDRGTESIGTWELRGKLNRAAAHVLADVLPAERGDGRRYPQTVMSPTYTISVHTRFRWSSENERFEASPLFRFEGHGWGHLVGMSQYGAQAMAQRGATYEEILAHYYGGLRPVPGAGVLPETVRVGLMVGVDDVEVVPEGPVRVLVDGEELVGDELGPWTFQADDAGVLVTPPAGLGLPPDLSGATVVFSRGGPSSVRVQLRSAAEVRVDGATGHRSVPVIDWKVTPPGIVEVPWRSIADALDVVSGPVFVEIRSRSPRGGDVEVVTVVPGGE